MGIAADNLDELILVFFKGFVIDAAGIHLAKTVFASLGDKAAAIAGIFVIDFFLIFIAHGSAVDDHVGALDGLFGLVARHHAHLDNLLPALFVDGELRAVPAGS